LDATPKSTTTADIAITPPPGGPWQSYDLTVCPIGGPQSGCKTQTCPAGTTTTTCLVTGLTPETTYVATAVAIKPDGTRSPPSNEDTFTTLAEPILTSAESFGPTTGQATATGPADANYTQWRFTATPVGGGPAVTATSPSPDVRFYGLTPNTTVGGSCAGCRSGCVALLPLPV